MDRTGIIAALNEIALLFADTRVNVFEVEVASLERNLVRLAGRVLEESNREVLLAHLARRFPEQRIDSREIIVVRNTDPRLLVVCVNLADLREGPSFEVRLAAQLFNGSPLQLLWEQDEWSFVRQVDGYLGWIHKQHLSPGLPLPPTHIVTAPVGILREHPLKEAGLVTRLLGGTLIAVRDEIEGWANLVLAGGADGWLPGDHLRALELLTDDPSRRRQMLAEDAAQMIGIPYLPGGCSAHGIDSSGFTQLLYRYIGVTLARDADMQYAAGKPVRPPFELGDLLFFGDAGRTPRITHTGISLGGWRMIHASRFRSGVYIDEVQAVAHLRESFLCAASFL